MKTIIAITFILISTSSFATMSKKHFIRVLESVEKVYAPIVAEKGAKLVLYQGYKFNTVNALSKQYGSDWIISFYGGLAKHRGISDDGLRFIVCHELGHHLGGAPYKIDGDGAVRWASAEAQADYFATNECLKKVFSVVSDNKSEVSKLSLPIRDELERICGDDLLCIRILSSSINAIDALNMLKKEKEILSFFDYDPKIVSETNLEYPSYQCRLDTTVAGYFNRDRPECWFFTN